MARTIVIATWRLRLSHFFCCSVGIFLLLNHLHADFGSIRQFELCYVKNRMRVTPRAKTLAALLLLATVLYTSSPPLASGDHAISASTHSRSTAAAWTSNHHVTHSASVPTTFGNASKEWIETVRYRHWSTIGDDDPKLCKNAQAAWAPREAEGDTYGPCTDSKYHGGPNPDWRLLAERYMAVDCVFSGSKVAQHILLNAPDPAAKVYVVFAQTTPAAPTQLDVARRKMAGWTLKRIRQQLGAQVEITLVDLFADSLDFDEVYGAGTINTAIMGWRHSGQDWGMYQEGINAIWHRVQQFDWIIVMNEVMVGPFGPLNDVLSKANGYQIYVASNWAHCCIRGFFVAFSRALIATDKWRHYWQRVSFPCAKLGPMFVGEGQMTLPPLEWKHCATSTNWPLSKTDPLSLQLSFEGTPFLYWRGIVDAFTGSDNNTDTEAIIQFLDQHHVPQVVVKPCNLAPL